MEAIQLHMSLNLLWIFNKIVIRPSIINYFFPILVRPLNPCGQTSGWMPLGGYNIIIITYNINYWHKQTVASYKTLWNYQANPPFYCIGLNSALRQNYFTARFYIWPWNQLSLKCNINTYLTTWLLNQHAYHMINVG